MTGAHCGCLWNLWWLWAARSQCSSGSGGFVWLRAVDARDGSYSESVQQDLVVSMSNCLGQKLIERYSMAQERMIHMFDRVDTEDNNNDEDDVLF